MKRRFLVIGKRLFAVVAISVGLIGCASLSARHMYNEPTAFNGVDLGSNINSAPGMQLERQDGNVKRCYRSSDTLNFAGITAKKITYVFYEDKLGEVVIVFNGLENFTTVKGSLEQQHGASLEQKQVMYQTVANTLGGKRQQIDEVANDECTWVGQNIYMKMRYKSGEGVLQIQSIPIMLKYAKRW
jgi:hypothetical protein